MKQNKRTTLFKLALLVVCIAVLATALVACGEKDKNGNNNEIVNFADNELCSADALESYVGYCIENNCIFACTRDPDFGNDLGPMFEMGIRGWTSEYYSVFVFICQSESDANKVSAPQYYQGYVVTQNKNVLIIEKEEGILQNEILKAKIPASYHGSELHINMIKEAFNSITTCDDEVDDIEFAYEYGENGEEFFYCHDMRMEYSQDKSWEFSNREEDVEDLEWLEELMPKLKTEYTDDSFINLNEEGGYYSTKLIERPDTYRYEDYSYIDSKTKIDGIRITDYICTKDSSKSLIVLAEIDNKPVLRVTLERLNATTVELSEGIVYFNIQNCRNLETVILPKSLKGIWNFIEGCYSLKTIKYAGTKAEWEERVKDNDPNNWYVEKEHDYENDKNTYKYITFKVECLDETITYSHE